MRQYRHRSGDAVSLSRDVYNAIPPSHYDHWAYTLWPRWRELAHDSYVADHHTFGK